jgi:plastocyanin
VTTVFVLALMAVGCGRDTPSTTSASVDLSDKTFSLKTSRSDVEVGALDNQFTPPYIEVKRGTTVTFVNEGRNPHNVLPAEDGALTPIETDAFQPDSTATVNFDIVGDYPFYCSLHGAPGKGMAGAVRVVE